MNRRLAIATLLYAATGLRRATAAEFGPKQIAALVLRVLAYDRNLKRRSDGKSAPVLVLYQEGNQASEAQQNDLVNALEDLANSVGVSGLPVKVSALAYKDLSSLEVRLAELRPVAIFISTGLGPALAGLSALSRKRAVLTMTLNTAFIKGGLSIGFAESEDRISVIVNLPAARAEGADLDASLLRIAEVYR